MTPELAVARAIDARLNATANRASTTGDDDGRRRDRGDDAHGRRAIDRDACDDVRDDSVEDDSVEDEWWSVGHTVGRSVIRSVGHTVIRSTTPRPVRAFARARALRFHVAPMRSISTEHHATIVRSIGRSFVRRFHSRSIPMPTSMVSCDARTISSH